MREGGTILALDLANGFGWASGSPGTHPFVGSGRFAPEGSSQAAIGAAATKWLADRLAVEKPYAIYIERPRLHTVAKGTSSYQSIYALLGLCYLAAAVAHLRGVYRVEAVEVRQVREHFIGKGSLPGPEAKKLVSERCAQLGWETANNDESDALAIWDFACERLAPGSGHKAIPGLFQYAPTVRKPRAKLPDRLSAVEARDLFKKGRGGK